MFKEIKYFIFITIFALFLFFSGKYYFSDTNKKKSYRSYNNINEKINTGPKPVSLQLPKLKKVGTPAASEPRKIKLPKLKKL